MRRRSRGMVPVVGKALELAVLVLLTAMLATALFGSALPAYRTAAGAELGDRTLATAAERVEDAVPRSARAVERDLRVALPDRIRGERYTIRADGRALVLDHPLAGIGGRARLALPPGVRATGAWSSDATPFVRVRGGNETLRVDLVERGVS